MYYNGVNLLLIWNNKLKLVLTVKVTATDFYDCFDDI